SLALQKNNADHRRRHGCLVVAAICGLSSYRDSGSPFYFCIRADEIRHASHALLDRILGSGVTETDVLAFVGYPRSEMDVRQHRDAGLVQEPLAEFLRILGSDHLAG